MYSSKNLTTPMSSPLKRGSSLPQSIHFEWSWIDGTVDLAVNTPSSNLFPELCAHWNWAGNSFYFIDHTHTLPIGLSMISIAGPRDNNNDSQPHCNVYSATGHTHVLQPMHWQ